MTRRDTIIDKIMGRCEVQNHGHTVDGVLSPCLVWQGPTSGKGRGGGYGRMCLDNQTVAVHIVVATHHYGYIPSKRQVDHLCNNRLCCNPAHLELVTHLKNQRRRAKRAKEQKT